MDKKTSSGKTDGPRLSRRLAWLLEYGLIMAVYFAVRLAPFSLVHRMGGWLGTFVFSIDKRHQKDTEDNLRSCLRDKSDEEIKQIAGSVYRNLGYSVVEFIRSDRYADAPIERHFEFVNYGAIGKALEKGRGIIYLTAHCGNWELLALAQAIRGHPFGVVVRPLDNPYIARAVTSVRTRYGNKMIKKKRAMREILKTLDENGAVGILLDQNVTRAEGVFVDFFGRPACTNKGMALIALKTKAPVLPAFIRRNGPDSHEIIVGDELPLVDTGNKDADVLANTQAYTREIEDFIRKYPDQWLWMHRRWKTKPEDA